LLGLNLACLAGEQYEVTGVLRGRHAMAAPGRTPFAVIPADLTVPGEAERVLDAVQPDVVVHCAALTSVDACEGHPEEAYQVNTRLPGLLARAVAHTGVRLVHISTDSVFDGLRGDYREEDQPNPVNVYARTKLEGERAVAQACPGAFIARVNFYGWSWQGTRSLAEFFYNNLTAGTPFFGYEDVFFCPLLVNDLVDILLRAAERRLEGLYHVVSSECLSKYTFAMLLAEKFGLDANLISPASYKNGGLKAARSPILTLRGEKLAGALGVPLPAQEPAMDRFFALLRDGYPQKLRALFVEPDHSFAG
jgi:dTDP-4-dehydrorhamnose reductase